MLYVPVKGAIFGSFFRRNGGGRSLLFSVGEDCFWRYRPIHCMMRARTMMKFTLSYENVDRANPHGVTVQVIAKVETDARRMTAAQKIDQTPDGSVWLDRDKTPCTRKQRTRRKVPEVLSVGMH